jgi:hypothetical protein
MATTTFGLPGQFLTDADFRAWGSAISNALAAMGLVKTADTGQINFTTVLKPASGQISMGYEIWRFNDVLQATAPVFIKLEYGSGQSAGTQLALWYTVGTGSDGAGNLNGNVGTRKPIYVSANQAAASNSYFSGATDRINFCINPGQTSMGIQLHIERSKDASGNNTSHGVTTYSNCSASVGGQEQYLPFVGVMPTAEVSPYAFAAAALTAVGGTDIGLFPHYPMFGKLLNPKMNVLTYMNQDLQPLVPIPVVMYGASHTYLPLGLNPQYSGSPSGRGVSGTSSCIMMRYE